MKAVLSTAGATEQSGTIFAIVVAIAGYLSWLGSVARHVLLWLKTGVWPSSMRLTELLVAGLAGSEVADSSAAPTT